MYLKYLSPDKSYCSFSPIPPEYVINPDYWTKDFKINPENLVSYDIIGDKKLGYNFSYKNVDLLAVFLHSLILYEDLDKNILASILNEFDKYIDVLKITYQTNEYNGAFYESTPLKMAIKSRNISLFDLLINAGANPKEELLNIDNEPIEIKEYLFNKNYKSIVLDHNGETCSILEDNIKLLQIIEPFVDFNEPLKMVNTQADLDFWLNSEANFKIKNPNRSFKDILPKPIPDEGFPFYFRVIKHILKENIDYDFEPKSDFSINYMFSLMNTYHFSSKMMNNLTNDFAHHTWIEKIEKIFLENNLNNNTSNTTKVIKI
jgi:hypothetical protein